MNPQTHFRARIKFLQRNPDNAGQRMGIDLHFAMQNFAGDGQRQLNHLAFDTAIVVAPFQCKRLKSVADLAPVLGESCIQFSAYLLLPSQPSLLEKFSLLPSRS
jgi:hypothetical protein